MTLEKIAEILNRYPEVKWDRCAMGVHPTYGNEYGCAFGWIERDDAHEDFLVIEWSDGESWMTTSSAKYSREFDLRLRGTDEDHGDCQRIDEVFGARVNRKIILPEGQA